MDEWKPLMGGATTICTDKTGTLTQNRMTVSRLWAAGESFGPFPSGSADHIPEMSGNTFGEMMSRETFGGALQVHPRSAQG